MMRFASRKFLAWVVVVVLATVGLYLKVVDQEVWFNAVVWATGLYIGGNVAQKAFTGK